MLDREKAAPKCYPRKLFNYGVSCLHNYLQFPNVLAGLLANEVVDRIESWPAATCVKAYGRDLKLYMEESGLDRPLPLIYAAQHSGIGAAFSVDEAMQVTMDYLTCDQPAIDVFGVNIESWCSSLATFERDEDGEEGSYYSLYQNMRASTIPLVFTEMGCSHDHFDKDNGLRDRDGTRDWKQVPVVLDDMQDTWSGFSAYAYSGNPMFDMFQGGPFRDSPLKPTKDFYNFKSELHSVIAHTLLPNVSTHFSQGHIFTSTAPKTCINVQQNLHSCCNIQLYSFNKIAPYRHNLLYAHILFIFLGIVFIFFVPKLYSWKNKKVKYQPIG